MFVSKYLLRYVVPFRWNNTDFESACSLLAKESFERSKAIESESDLFSYVREEFISISDASRNAKYGISFDYDFKGKEPILYLFPGGTGEKIDFDYDGIKKLPKININKAGLYLFRNGLAFFWYEIILNSGAKDKRLSTDLITEFQYQFKELNRNKSCFWQYIKGAVPCSVKKFISVKETHGEKAVEKKYAPFSVGKWIYETVSFLKPVFVPSRKSAYASMVAESFKRVSPKYDAAENENFKEDDSDLPDKALLFGYYSVYRSDGDIPDEEVIITEEERNLAFRFSNGYTKAYQFSSYSVSQMISPFSNVLWYASNEGCSYLAFPCKNNSDFFEGTMITKYTNDYFILYIKCLYISYSMIYYTEKVNEAINRELSPSGEKAGLDSIRELMAELNRFSVNTASSSVSFVTHQTMFYRYLRERLTVENDLSNLRTLLSSLNETEDKKEEKLHAEEKEAEELQDKEREKRYNSIARVLAWLVIWSALIDSYDFLAKIHPAESFSALFGDGIGWVLLYSIVIGTIIVPVIWTLYSLWKINKDDKKKMKGKQENGK